MRTTSRRHIFAAVTAAASLAVAVGVVALMRSMLPAWGATPAQVMRPIEPFVGRGDLGLPDSPLVQNEMPESYGYTAGAGGVYRWTPGMNQANRGDFAWVRGPGYRGPAGAFRVLVLGASVAYGTGASGADRWFEVAERDMTCRGLETVFLPLACGAWVTAQERVAFELWGLEIKPDAVVLVNGFNDAYAACEGARPGDPVFTGIDYGIFYGAIETDRGVVSLGFNRPAAIRELQAHAKRMAKSAEYAEIVAGEYRRHVNAIVRRCRLEGIPVLPVLQPARVEAGGTSTGDTDDLVRACYAAIRSAPPDGLADAARVVDAAAYSFAGDTCHFNAAGHRDFGLWVSDQLSKGMHNGGAVPAR